jgi:hypothetical protein
VTGIAEAFTEFHKQGVIGGGLKVFEGFGYALHGF